MLCCVCVCVFVCFCQAEDGIRDLVRSRGLGDVYKRQPHGSEVDAVSLDDEIVGEGAELGQAVIERMLGGKVLGLSLIHI